MIYAGTIEKIFQMVWCKLYNSIAKCKNCEKEKQTIIFQVRVVL